MVTSVWRLRSSTNTIVEGFLEQTPGKSYVVTVTFGADTFLDETYPDAPSATSRALQIRDGLLERGSWTVVVDAPFVDARSRASNIHSDQAQASNGVASTAVLHSIADADARAGDRRAPPRRHGGIPKHPP